MAGLMQSVRTICYNALDRASSNTHGLGQPEFPEIPRKFEQVAKKTAAAVTRSRNESSAMALPCGAVQAKPRDETDESAKRQSESALS